MASVCAVRAAFLDQHAGASVVDVGCGSGVYVDYLAETGRDAVGVDRVPAFVAAAKETYQGRFVEGDAYDLPFEDDTFETGVAFDVLEHVDDDRALAELARVTSKNVLIAVPHETPDAIRESGFVHSHYRDRSHLRYYDQLSLTALVGRAGLIPVAFETADPPNLRALIDATVETRRRWHLRFIRHALRHWAKIHMPPATLLVAARRAD